MKDTKDITWIMKGINWSRYHIVSNLFARLRN